MLSIDVLDLASSKGTIDLESSSIPGGRRLRFDLLGRIELESSITTDGVIDKLSMMRKMDSCNKYKIFDFF